MSADGDLSYDEVLAHLHGLIGERVTAAVFPAGGGIVPVLVAHGELRYGRETAIAEPGPDTGAAVTVFSLGSLDAGGLFTVMPDRIERAWLWTNEAGSPRLTLVRTDLPDLELHITAAGNVGL